MKSWISGLAIAGLALTPLALIGIMYGGDLIAGAAGETVADNRDTEGKRRDEMLVELTTRYVAQGRLVTVPMRKGVELAPIAFLNAELGRVGAKWRVASIEGAKAETFDIS